MEYFDNFFDKVFIDTLAHKLMSSKWSADNTANRNSWPYNKIGSHKFLGQTFFTRKSEDWIDYNKDLDLAKTLVDQWGYIKQRLNAQHLRLRECTGNLQFYKQDGQNHVDGDKGEVACILMLADEYIDGNIGGEFYNETQKVTVPFKQGRLIVFDASDLHRGTSFTKENMARLSIKWVGTPLTDRQNYDTIKT